jgi:Cys-rich protein (TIGR01571 family)
MKSPPYAIPVDPTKPRSDQVEVAVAVQDDEPKPLKDASGISIGQWDAQFCDCCTHCVPNCLMATFCQCISVAQISARLGMIPYTCAMISLVLLFSFTCGIAHAALFVWIWQVRQLTRERFQIPGDSCEDYCAAFWCPCCTLAQIATHIKSYKPGTCDFGPPDTLPPYKRV